MVTTWLASLGEGSHAVAGVGDSWGDSYGAGDGYYADGDGYSYGDGCDGDGIGGDCYGLGFGSGRGHGW